MSDIQVVPKVFMGRRRFSELTSPVIISKTIGGERPASLQEAQELGLMLLPSPQAATRLRTGHPFATAPLW